MFQKRYGILVMTLLLVAALSVGALGSTPAGTQITNQATATYKADGKSRTSASNVVYVTVEQVAGVTVGPTSAQSREVVAGQVVQHVYTVKNTGNGTDTFNLDKAISGSLTGVTVEWFHDINGNGVINSGEPVVTEIKLGAGEEANLIARFTVPSTAASGDDLTLALEAASTIAAGVTGQSEPVTYKVTDKDVVTAVLERNVGEVDVGEDITYTVKVTNQTSQAIGTVDVELKIPGHTTFVAGSLTSLAVAVTDPGTWPATVTVSNLAPSQTAVITYKVNVNADAPAAYIENSAEVKAGVGAKFHTNTVRTLVKQTANVSISQTGDPGDYTIDPAKVGHEYEFKYTVKNEGNGDDTIYVDTSNLPADWPVQLYKSDGVTPLPKQDGKYTVGELGSGDSTDIVVKVLVPVDLNSGAGPFNLETTVTSKSDSSKDATETATFDNVEGAGVTVTVGPDPVDGKGVPNPGAVVEYPVKIKNDGPTDDTFDLIGEDFPPGTIVEFVDKDGNPITEVSLEPGEETEVYVRITIPADGEPGDKIGGDIIGRSQNNPGVESDVPVEIEVADYINFNIAPDRIGSVNQGSFSVYEFTITNNGNSEKTFDLSIDGANKLTYLIQDAANNTINAINVAKGASAKVKVRVDSDYTTHLGWTESVRLVAETDSITSSASLTTTVIGSELQMEKSADVTDQIPGGTIEYTVTATNISVGPLTDVVIYDAVPAHTVYVSSTGPGTKEYSTDGGATWVATADAKDITHVRYNAGTLAVNGTATVELIVKVK